MGMIPTRQEWDQDRRASAVGSETGSMYYIEEDGAVLGDQMIGRSACISPRVDPGFHGSSEDFYYLKAVCCKLLIETDEEEFLATVGQDHWSVPLRGKSARFGDWAEVMQSIREAVGL